MIKVEVRDEIHYFVNEEAFGNQLVNNEYAKELEFFVNDEYSAWEVLSEEYSFDEIYSHCWESEVKDEIREWFNRGDVEEIN